MDKAFLYQKQSQSGESDFLQPYVHTYLSYSRVVELAERYQIETSFEQEEISVKAHKISERLERIYGSQLALNMRHEPQLGFACGWRASITDVYFRHIILLLCVPVFFFLVSHTNIINSLVVVLVGIILGMISMTMGLLTGGVLTVFAYIILLLMAAQEGTKTVRLASLLVAPCTLGFAWVSSVFLFMILTVLTVSELSSLALCLIFTTTTTVLISAYFIKRYFDPIV